MILPHITFSREERIVRSKDINVIPVCWDQLQEGDMVFIGGNINYAHEVTELYGKHKVINTKTHELMNSRGQTFYERSTILFKEEN